MNIFNTLQRSVTSAVKKEYGVEISPSAVLVQPTKKEFTGEYTVVTFPLAKQLKNSPENIAETLGDRLVHADSQISAYNVVKGFLNLTMSESYWREALQQMPDDILPLQEAGRAGKVLVEFSSPNTNKPLHLGHIRNILLGWAMSRIFKATGHEVVNVQIVNDRGIAICKSMLAWKKYAGGATPESDNMKPDHFVGKWYVRFEQEFKKEYDKWQETEAGRQVYEQNHGEQDPQAFFKKYKNTYFNEVSPLGSEARELLRKWEAGDEDVRALWHKMNGWVYEGFEETYNRLGVSFDKLYYESQTYLLGKDLVQRGLDNDVFYRQDDGSVWVNLESEGMDQKILLRSDGTSVYITQDLGTAELRYQDFGTERMIYVVADEQNYHFQALFATLKKLGTPYAEGLHHLSYGMVDLPTGTMKTREGTVVDADDLMDEVFEEARKGTDERGEIAGLSEAEQHEILRKISLAALKFFIIKVDPKKRMTFNPAESVDLQGQTGPYIQNAYVRIRSVLRKAGNEQSTLNPEYQMAEEERLLIASLDAFGETIQSAEDQYNPAIIANYCYQLAKDFHRYYHEYRILNAETENARKFRLVLISHIANVLKTGMALLGIEMPERM